MKTLTRCSKLIKVICLLLLSIISSSNSSAQQFTGRVTYISHKKMDMKLDSTRYDMETRNRVTAIFAKQFQKSYILDFTVSKSLYSEQGKMNVNSTSTAGTDKLFKNFELKTYIHKLEFLGKQFLIKDSIKSKSWVIKDETKSIGNYLCTKATYNRKKEDSLITITAWFSKDLPVSNGPGIYDGLPGLILQIDDGIYTILSTRIELYTDNTIKQPKRGKVVTQSEYDIIYNEKQKEGAKTLLYLQGIERGKLKNEN